MQPALTADALVLALETSGSLGSVAIGTGRGAHVRARTFLEGQIRHAAELVPRVAETLAVAGIAREEIGGVVVGGGPGSFTGVRVAAATGKGIAHALGVPMWAFSSLEAAALGEHVALPASPALSSGVRYVLFDARAHRIYAGCYRIGPGGAEEMIPPHAAELDGVLADDVPPGAVFVGDGATRHRHEIEKRGFEVLQPPAGIPTAETLLHLLSLRPDAVPLGRENRWEPAYVRASSAERVRAR